MPYKDRIAKNVYQLQWYNRNKEQAFSQLGNKCVTCGSSSKLELDHINPQTKVSHRIYSWSVIRRAEELKKCQLLCYDCHLDKTLRQRKSEGSTPDLATNLTE